MTTPGGPEKGPYDQQPYVEPQSPYGEQAPYGQQPPYQEPQHPYMDAQAQYPDPQAYGQPQQPYPYGYYQQGYGGYMPQPGTNGLAIASMIVGIIWIYWLGSLLAVIFGHIALSQTARTGQQGRGMAIAGVVLGWVGLAILGAIIVWAIFIADDDAFSEIMRTAFTGLRASL
ncbi:DUF4190 domain-containing protein [Streptomyces sp. SID3343]|uniref:DUF4190 domain-containing protein n=1 Tax=Streptomyces sp. SID3343 TaxID=2690260 RepID=UPI00136D867D|nr:DUF4190 domain-containing protein [Streptomyces sp. SID3343]MYW03678.1 DUF4190 domain-containing protein [Streptomyces sp. SID3343]